MSDKLTGKELLNLVDSVFSPGTEDTSLAVLVDLPDSADQDDPAWKTRRRIAYEWVQELNRNLPAGSMQKAVLVAYANVHSNNADLPDKAVILESSPEHILSGQLKDKVQSFREILKTHRLILAPTQYSTTAPLKLMAKDLGFRAATMPGFSLSMVPALRLDYGEINRRVLAIKDLLDPAVAMDIEMTVDDKETFRIHFDLRFREAHASGGRFPQPGIAGNLPSGECYIVPYEGERGEPSLSRGILPVQLGEEVVIYRIERNLAREVLSQGPVSDEEKEKIAREPAYANIAELGFGVLADFGMKPMGEILLDEKLGLHIAFGRSDHFGGAVGVANFSAPDQVVHIDRIYIPETQNRICADRVSLTFDGKPEMTLMEKGEYTIF